MQSDEYAKMTSASERRIENERRSSWIATQNSTQREAKSPYSFVSEEVCISTVNVTNVHKNTVENAKYIVSHESMYVRYE